MLDREATVDKLAEHTAEAAGAGTELVAFPETFVSVFPSSVWAKALAGWSDPRAKTAFAQLFESVVGSQARLPIDSERSRGSTPPGMRSTRPGTEPHALRYHAPDGSLALEHRKLIPTNHERLV